ncbi:MAG: phytoene/squalene synthase family protein [Microlunatus sp.]|nr:phytoene/squalene synthase family protein [Microlunatus sp.]
MTLTQSIDPRRLHAGYRECGRLTRRFGTTYFWGAALLPRRQRKHVYAVYALCRLADDIVDLPPTSSPMVGAGRAVGSDLRVSSAPSATGPYLSPVGPAGHDSEIGIRLRDFADRFRAALASGDGEDPVLAAVATTARECEIDPECFDRFFDAMAMDLTTSTYETWEDLCGYMEGSAAVIGEMMLPVLEPTTRAAKAPARALGLAFQLTNFLRDVNEDLTRGRVYLPQEDLRRFGVDLRWRHTTPEWRALMAYEIERNRALYSFADTGIAMLPPRSARCVGAARVLYAQILDRIEKVNYNVFNGRARVPTARKALTAARIMVTGPRLGPAPA